MHELSLCRSIYSIAIRAANGKPVTKIALDVGELRQVVPETLVYCWGIVTQKTALAGSELAVTHIATVIKCRDCEKQTRLHDIPVLSCEECSSINVEIISGEEFQVSFIEVRN